MIKENEERMESLKEEAIALGATPSTVAMLSTPGNPEVRGIIDKGEERIKLASHEEALTTVGSGLTPEEEKARPSGNIIEPSPNEDFEEMIFNGGSYEIDDFNSGVLGPVVQADNKRSVKHTAATVSLLTGSMDEALDTFNSIVAESSGSHQTTQKDLVSRMQATTLEKSNSILPEVLTGTDLTDDEKLKAIKEASDLTSEQYSPISMLAEKSLAAPSALETPVSGEQRLGWASMMQAVNHKREVLNHLDTTMASHLDPSAAGAVADIAMMLVPTFDSSVISRIHKDLKESGLPVGDMEGGWLMGAEKQDIVRALNNASPEDFDAIAGKVAELISTHSGLPIAGGNNDLNKFFLFKEMMSGEDYTNADEFVDSLFHMLDITVIGGNIARGLKRGGKIAGSVAENTMRDAFRSRVRSQAPSNSNAKAVQANNPESARDLHRQAAADETGESAEALYGATREDAIVDDIMPQVESLEGVVKHKVGDIDLEISEDVLSLARSGENERSLAEKQGLWNKYVNFFTNVTGMSMRREMVTVGSIKVPNKIDEIEDGVSVNAVYGPAEGGFSNAQDAMDMTLLHMRDRGIDENSITILQRVGDEYRPVTLREGNQWDEATKALEEQGVKIKPRAGEILPSNDYLVQIKSEYRFKDSDVGVWDEASVKHNWFERISATSGVVGRKTAGFFSAIQTYALDAASMLHPALTFKPATTAVARAAAIEKELLESGGEFGKIFMGLKRDRQEVLEDIIKESNAKGTEYTYTQAMADGLSNKEFHALKLWRLTWDNIYTLENGDAVRSLRNGGYKELINAEVDTKLFAKPLNKGNPNIPKNPTVYDTATGKSKLLTEADVAKLYEEGGTIARLRSPVTMGGADYDIIAVAGKGDGSYLRELGENSKALQYRKGYYSVKYEDKWFIDKISKRADGTEYRTAVATASTEKEAKLLQRQMDQQDPGKVRELSDGTRVYESKFGVPREDLKGNTSSSDSFDLAHNSGRSVQRVRGERLSGVSDTGGLDPLKANIAGPVESMLSSTRSVANRVGMRKIIDTSKERFRNQFGGLLPLDPVTKQPVWPDKISDIGHRRETDYSRKQLADARTTWNYINYLENGYVNYIDEGYKAGLNWMANIVGDKSVAFGKVLNYLEDTRGPTAFGKNVAFQAYLALNPFRQLAVQSHQAIQLTANFGKDALKSPAYVSVLTFMQLGAKGKDIPESYLDLMGMTAKGADDMFKAFKRSGLIASIDKQNLVRSGMSHLADQKAALPVLGKAGAVAADAVGFVRKMGFDLGESIHMMSNWAAHYSRAKRKGLDINNKSVLDDITADAINYGLNMNAAGDMRYNVDSLGLLFQFLQVPHKALTQMTVNRVLSGEEKARLAGWNLLMYGIPTTIAVELYEQAFPEGSSEEVKHAFLHGAESLILNKTLNDNVGTMSDWASFHPTGSYGLVETVTEMVSAGPIEAWLKSPSAKLFVGSNPRITDAIKTTLRAFNVMDDSEETPTTMMMAGKEFLKISSGMSNIFKGLYMRELSKSMSSKDLTVTEEDTWRTMLLGVPPVKETYGRMTIEKTYGLSKDFNEDIKYSYNEFKKQLARAGVEKGSGEWVSRINSEVYRAYQGSPELLEMAHQKIQGFIRRDTARSDVSLLDSLLRTNGLMEDDEFMSYIKLLPEEEGLADKKETIELMEWMRSR